ncbi:hypothetical protein BLNAU_22171 [Blattamonas nauphoetae]|uniref:Secreted protein n=1 Tax=Blattamonas nauphoetae TaxID=2049346 RepID=A0ABQ9WW24_9EUKA|nr:hypothetical protein BLNAU_22171 [Blattamonas nauphoetae]
MLSLLLLRILWLPFPFGLPPPLFGLILFQHHSLSSSCPFILPLTHCILRFLFLTPSQPSPSHTQRVASSDSLDRLVLSGSSIERQVLTHSVSSLLRLRAVEH